MSDIRATPNMVQLGRIVHFVAAQPGGFCEAALVNKVWDEQGLNGCANLSVFRGDSLYNATSVVRKPPGETYGWHWPSEHA